MSTEETEERRRGLTCYRSESLLASPLSSAAKLPDLVLGCGSGPEWAGAGARIRRVNSHHSLWLARVARCWARRGAASCSENSGVYLKATGPAPAPPSGPSKQPTADNLIILQHSHVGFVGPGLILLCVLFVTRLIIGTSRNASEDGSTA